MNTLPTAASLAFSSREFLRLVESYGLTGSWGWTFATNAQVWSPGLYRLLGLEAGTIRPSYELLLSVVHPEDRLRLDPVVRVMRDGILGEHTFRVIRPDGTERVLQSRGEVSFSPDARPRAASGFLLDVTERERLARAQAAEKRRRRALFEQARCYVSSTQCYPFTDFSAEYLALTGLPKPVLLEEPTRPVIAEERRHWRDYGRELYRTQQIVHVTPRITLAGGEQARFRFVMVPMRNALGIVESWTNFVGPADRPLPLPSDDLRRSLEERVGGHHLRAARALLDWSMTDLATVSGLSFSTVRRLEDGAEGAERSRHAAIAALRAAGIRFSLMDGATIAVARGAVETA
ncbi:MAG TPA: PAS domain-containing protein [Methylobacterium sp.]|nr:PAS domain-containing protein [Methylobacterium sp.]